MSVIPLQQKEWIAAVPKPVAQALDDSKPTPIQRV
jgi:hypothetical protein